MNDCIHYENITFDNCRDCREESTQFCQHYIPYSTHSVSETYVPLMVRSNVRKRKFLPRDLLDWIRRNDRSAI